MAKDDWVRAAMGDDTVVVELLVRLKKHRQTATATAAAAAVVAAKLVLPPLRWGLRQPRSRTTSAVLRCGDAFSRRKDGDSTRGSPTTPLSWSGGTASPSGTVDGFEESSRPTPLPNRSKGAATVETNSATSKKSRRKKTFAELKEEETLLLEERLHLTKELATLHATFREQRARNESLKRIKFDLGLQPLEAAGNTGETKETTSHQHSQRSVALATSNEQEAPESCQSPRNVSSRDGGFMLPDLNMVPSEEDSGSETLCGMS